jgi:hypothetical protein
MVQSAAALALRQLSKFAAASTIPVTNAAMQENSRISLITLAIVTSPVSLPQARAAALKHSKTLAKRGRQAAQIGAKRTADWAWPAGGLGVTAVAGEASSLADVKSWRAAAV